MKFEPFVFEERDEENAKYLSGEETINVSAAGMVFECTLRVMEEVNKDLNEILGNISNLPFRMVRKFIVDFYQMDLMDQVLYSAFKAPKDDIFYQP